MENKSNASTPNRPDGDRRLDGAFINMDLNLFIEQLQNEPAWKNSDRNSITIFKADTMRIVLLGLHKGAALKTHTANGIISVQLLKGKIDFTAEQQNVTLEKGQMLALHEKIPHSVLALEQSFFLLTLGASKG